MSATRTWGCWAGSIRAASAGCFPECNLLSWTLGWIETPSSTFRISFSRTRKITTRSSKRRKLARWALQRNSRRQGWGLLLHLPRRRTKKQRLRWSLLFRQSHKYPAGPRQPRRYSKANPSRQLPLKRPSHLQQRRPLPLPFHLDPRGKRMSRAISSRAVAAGGIGGEGLVSIVRESTSSSHGRRVLLLLRSRSCPENPWRSTAMRSQSRQGLRWRRASLPSQRQWRPRPWNKAKAEAPQRLVRQNLKVWSRLRRLLLPQLTSRKSNFRPNPRSKTNCTPRPW